MKLFPLQIGLRLKLTLPVVFLILVIMFSISFLFGLRHEQTLRSEMKRRAVRVAQTAGTMSLIPLPGVPAWTLSKSFVPLVPQLDPNVLYIVVFDELGKVQAASINQSLLKELLKQEEIASAEKELITEVTNARGIREERSGPSRWGSLLPVEVGLQPDGRGKVVVGFSLEEMEREVSSSRRTALGLTLGFVVLGVVVAVAVAASITQPIQVLVRGMEEVRKGNLAADVEIPNKDEIGALANSFNFMIAGLRERDRIKGTFQRFVSSQVAEKVLGAKDIVLTGERRRASILFADIRGFTSMSERLAPEEIVSMLNEYFTVMVDIIITHEGNLDKFIGDAMMAVFGAPLRHPDDPLRAVRTAVDMQRALLELNEERDRRGAEAIYIGIGIATGDVVAGNIGSEKRMEYSVIGDEVNLAARIQSKSGKQKILICPETFKAVQGEIKTIPLEPVMLKGKSHPVQIYEVVY
ncbi:adenylate/guanylate cyclase domain-containing protein [Candidatus Manganitrophus noduliformans]|uniref:Adenylate/guanylate cyclase domain-containing protein n=1 Tax=Candidatus Manganitrophus noduliformans TaxID=2606439 RepID=A0A7X6DLI5_9BACT|nr:adenylate/guanylate cyclase domain-containing protein [Candidatus Manganitrophus noduliformans]NKE69404.1 adenylate/guanylate cyclase domain-containing protein [Candidatus Manganitrophus noduliformans]